MQIGKYKISISPYVEGKNIGKQVIDDVAPEKVGSSLGSKIGSGMKTGLKIGGAALGAAAVGIGSLGGAAIKAQAEIQQSLGGSEAVFENNAQVVKNWAASAAGSMGISTNMALETANKMGSLFQGAGISAKQSSEMTMDMSKRAADVASVMGVDLESAMEAVTGAAKGNFTMMDNLGVAMNNTTLEAYAQSKGIDKTFASMENAEKIGLAYQLFMEKTGKYAGNFEKENQTLAGSFDVLGSSWQNVLYSMGDPKMLDSAIQQLSKAITNMFAAVSEVLPSIITSIGTLLTDLLPIIIEAINTLLPELVTMLTKTLGTLIQTLVDALPSLITTLIDAISNLLPVLLEAIYILVEGIIAVLPMLITAIVDFMNQNQKAVGDVLYKLLFAIIDLIPVLVEALAEALPMIVGVLIQGMIMSTPLFAKAAWKLLVAIILLIPALINGLASGMEKAMLSMISSVTKAGPGMLKSSGQAFGNISKGFNDWVSGFNAKVKGFFTGLVDWMKNAWGSTQSIGKDLIRGIWEGIKAMGNWLKDKIKGFADSTIGSIKDFFGIHSPSVIMRKEVGMMIGAGVGLGIQDSGKSVAKKASSFSSRISDAINVASAYDFGYNDDINANGGIGSAGGVTTNIYTDAPKDMLDMFLLNKRATIQGVQGAK